MNGEEIEERLEEDGFVAIAEFTCPTEQETYISEARLISERGYISGKSVKECPYCGRDGHWEDALQIL